jgi:hypothetical protein
MFTCWALRLVPSPKIKSNAIKHAAANLNRDFDNWGVKLFIGLKFRVKKEGLKKFVFSNVSYINHNVNS